MMMQGTHHDPLLTLEYGQPTTRAVPWVVARWVRQVPQR